MQRLEFTFEVLPLADPAGEPAPRTRSGLATPAFGQTNNALKFIYSCGYTDHVTLHQLTFILSTAIWGPRDSLSLHHSHSTADAKP